MKLRPFAEKREKEIIGEEETIEEGTKTKTIEQKLKGI